MQVHSSHRPAHGASFRTRLLCVLEEVFDVPVPVFDVAYAVVREAFLPDVELPLQGALGLKGESTFDELDGLFKWHLEG